MNLRPFAVLLLVVLMLFLTAPPSSAGWGAGSCTVVQTAPAFSGWEARNDAPHCMGYFVDGVQVAYYNSRTHIYRTYDAATDTWGKPQRAPWTKAEPCKSNCPCEQCEDGCECTKGAPCGDGRCGCILTKEKREKIVTAIQFLDAQFIAGDITEAEYVKRLDPLWIELTGQPHGPLRAASACACGCGCGSNCPCAQAGPCEEGCSCQTTRRSVSAAKNPGRKRDCQWTEADGSMNYGVDLTKLGGHERASINGRSVSKKQFLDAIGAPAIPDDANLLRLTIVAEDKAALEHVRASLAPALAPFAEKLVIQWYTKDNWAVRPQYGFAFPHLPALLLEEPEKPGQKGGRALLQAKVSSDPTTLIAAVRSKVDGFDPKKVPGVPGPTGPVNMPAVLAVGTLAAAGWLIFRK